MSLVKCPDCGKMVSERALTCPDCGCPSEYFIEQEETTIHKDCSYDTSVDKYNTNDQIEFLIYDHIITYPKDIEAFSHLYGKFAGLGYKARQSAEKLYDFHVSKGFQLVLDDFTLVPEISKKYVEECEHIVDSASKLLYDNDINFLPDQLYKMANEVFNDISYRSAISDFLNKYDQIVQKYNNSNQDNNADKEITNEINALLQDSAIRSDFCEPFNVIYFQMFQIVIRLLGYGSEWDALMLNPVEAKAIESLALKHETEIYSIGNKLSKALSCWPFSTTALLRLKYYKYMDETDIQNDIDRFTAFWNLDFYFEDVQYIAEINKDNFKDRVKCFESLANIKFGRSDPMQGRLSLVYSTIIVEFDDTVNDNQRFFLPLNLVINVKVKEDRLFIETQINYSTITVTFVENQNLLANSWQQAIIHAKKGNIYCYRNNIGEIIPASIFEDLIDAMLKNNPLSLNDTSILLLTEVLLNQKHRYYLAIRNNSFSLRHLDEKLVDYNVMKQMVKKIEVNKGGNIALKYKGNVMSDKITLLDDTLDINHVVNLLSKND